MRGHFEGGIPGTIVVGGQVSRGRVCNYPTFVCRSCPCFFMGRGLYISLVRGSTIEYVRIESGGTGPSAPRV